MKWHSHIVAGGGWVTKEIVGKPRARFFGFLSVAWLGISIWASSSFWDGWPQSFRWLEWLCIMLLVPQLVFVTLSVIMFLTERPRTITEQHPNPDCDIGKLY
jgi:hypothetical protein